MLNAILFVSSFLAIALMLFFIVNSDVRKTDKS